MELLIEKELCRISEIVLKNVSKGQSVNQRVKIICETVKLVIYHFFFFFFMARVGINKHFKGKMFHNPKTYT